MKKRWLETTWRSASNKFVRAQKLPRGTRVVLFGRHGRRVRNDLEIRRRPMSSVPSLENTETAKDLIEAFVQRLPADPRRAGKKIRIIAPNGHEVGPNMQIGKLRNMEGKPSLAEKELAAAEEAETLEAQEIMEHRIYELQEGRNYEIGLPATLRALARVYGSDSVKEALKFL